jgi:chromosome segregation protein
MLDAGQQEKRLAADIAAWEQRAAESAAALAALEERGAALAADRALAAGPDDAGERLRHFDRDIALAESERAAAAAAVVTAEAERARLQAEAVASAGAVADRREGRATAAAAAEQVRARLDTLRAEAVERFGVPPQGLAADAALPADPAALADLIAGRTAERDRLGIVNLRAAIELEELATAQTARLAEREDLLGAIARLRGAIGGLNREGRARLDAAFATVDGHFRTLFATLFGGGAAELELVENDDPLDAGLEIRAQPPGKKLQSLSLLSGGEQALTAAALIFALFLANPAPVCVLDEVDAPLDDANVARFLHLLDHMVATTSTRFLIVTHNPVTMSRMHRLYGVTMAEPGVSRLVAVDLAEAVALVP